MKVIVPLPAQRAGVGLLFLPAPRFPLFVRLTHSGFHTLIPEQLNSIFYFSELYNSEKHIHVIQYLNNRLDIITKTSLDYTIRCDSKTALLVVIWAPS